MLEDIIHERLCHNREKGIIRRKFTWGKPGIHNERHRRDAGADVRIKRCRHRIAANQLVIAYDGD